MKLEEIEAILKQERSHNPSMLKPKTKLDALGNIKRTHPLQPSVISKIENGENYFFSSLLHFAYIYGYKIKCNDSIINSCEEFGKELVKYRTAKGLSQVQMTFLCGFKSLRYPKMERGQLSRDSLSIFLSSFPDFKLELIK